MAVEPELVRRTLTVAEAARILGIGETLAWQLIASGELRSIKLGRRRLIPADAVDELLARK